MVIKPVRIPLSMYHAPLRSNLPGREYFRACHRGNPIDTRSRPLSILLEKQAQLQSIRKGGKYCLGQSEYTSANGIVFIRT